ncbi:MAG: tetratricopeptide repeat protein [Planctomycetales bacterium]|nr:tetratricopeptide repeat protein [Planctomycetales bacterium]
MPTTINGIGTQYYGRRNPRVYGGVCESCRRNVTLADYETGYYFVVVFIPIIPLGKKQIIGECSACRRHRVMPLREWERVRDESLESGMNALAENMDDPSKAIELLHKMTVFNQMGEAMELAAATAKQHSQDFETLVDIGSWYEQHNQTRLSDQCFEQAIALAPDHPTSKRIQGVGALQAGKPQEAATYFESLRKSPDFYDPGLFYMLANAYQAAEMHAEAIEEFKDLMGRNAEFANDKTFRKAVKKSEKALGNPTSILPKKGLFG